MEIRSVCMVHEHAHMLSLCYISAKGSKSKSKRNAIVNDRSYGANSAWAMKKNKDLCII